MFFQLSPIGNYTDAGLIIAGLYLFTSYVVREEIWNKTIAYIAFTIISLAIIMYPLIFLEQKEIYFTSPEKTKTVVIVERSFFLGGYSTLYEKKYFLFKKPVNWNRIDGLNNFSSGYFTIHWISDKAAIMKRNGEHYGQINLD